MFKSTRKPLFFCSVLVNYACVCQYHLLFVGMLWLFCVNTRPRDLFTLCVEVIFLSLFLRDRKTFLSFGILEQPIFFVTTSKNEFCTVQNTNNIEIFCCHETEWTSSSLYLREKPCSSVTTRENGFPRFRDTFFSLLPRDRKTFSYSLSWNRQYFL